MFYGILYFFHPTDIYNEESYIKYIRFIVVLMFLIININSIWIDRLFKWISVSLLFLLQFVFATNSTNYDWLNYINFVLPTMIPICCPNLISKSVNINKLCLITYIVSNIFAYIEYFYFNGLFTRFSRSGYRVISIFVNPNNFGLILVILTCIILYNYNFSNVCKLMIVSNSLFVIYLTGCRTALLSLIVVLFLYAFHNVNRKKKIKKQSIIMFISVLYLAVGVILLFNKVDFQLNVRDRIDISSGNIFSISNDARVESNHHFILEAKKNPLFPWAYEFKNLDNMYFYLWGRFGLIAFLIFLLWQFYTLKIVLLNKNNLNISLWIVFLTAGVTTNFLYIWPISYFYWYYISCIFKNRSNLRVKEGEN